MSGSPARSESDTVPSSDGASFELNSPLRSGFLCSPFAQIRPSDASHTGSVSSGLPVVPQHPSIALPQPAYTLDQLAALQHAQQHQAQLASLGAIVQQMNSLASSQQPAACGAFAPAASLAPSLHLGFSNIGSMPTVSGGTAGQAAQQSESAQAQTAEQHNAHQQAVAAGTYQLAAAHQQLSALHLGQPQPPVLQHPPAPTPQAIPVPQLVPVLTAAHDGSSVLSYVSQPSLDAARNHAMSTMQPAQMVPQAGVPFATPAPVTVMSPPAAPATVVSPPAAKASTRAASEQQSGTVRVLCSYGGRFSKQDGAGAGYVGGETRLVNVRPYCSFEELVEALERVTSSASEESSGGTTSFVLSLRSMFKYTLPWGPPVLVDLKTNDDVAMMFSELEDAAAAAADASGGAAPPKLHIYVQDNGARHSGSGGTPDAGSHEARHESGTSTATGDSDQLHVHSAGHVGSHGPDTPAAHEVASGSNGSDMSSGGTSASTVKMELQALAERLEIIDPSEIRLVRFLGSGSYGEVYLGTWRSSEVAVKCLNPNLFSYDDGALSRNAIQELIREADILGSLRHPNIVFVYGLVLPDLSRAESMEDGASDTEHPSAAVPGSGAGGNGTGRERDLPELIAASAQRMTGMVKPPAVVTEYMGMRSLRGCLNRRTEMLAAPYARVLVALDVARGMEYLHSKKIVHFDLKSGNVLMGLKDKRPVAKVADFGLSKQKHQTFVSGVTNQRGTLPWIAPEILRTPNMVTERADVYSFAVVLWELWTLREPYDGMNYHALLMQLAADNNLRPALPGSADWPSDAPQEPTSGWADLVQRCWVADPEERPTFADIVATLQTMAVTAKRELQRTKRALSAPTTRAESGAAVEPTPAQMMPATTAVPLSGPVPVEPLHPLPGHPQEAEALLR